MSTFEHCVDIILNNLNIRLYQKKGRTDNSSIIMQTVLVSTYETKDLFAYSKYINNAHTKQNTQQKNLNLYNIFVSVCVNKYLKIGIFSCKRIIYNM